MIRILLLSLIILTYSFSSSKDLEEISLQLNWKYQFEYAGFLAAKEKGYYKDENLDVEIKEFNNLDVLNEIESGNATYGVYDISLLSFDNKESSIKLIANYFKRSALIFIATQDVITPEDLKNKTIMAEPSQMASSTLNTLLKKFDIKENDYNLVKHSFDAQDFIDGKVDVISAYISNELYYIKKSKKPYTIIDPLSYGIYGSGVNVFTSKLETINNPERVRRFINATNKGWIYALENKEEIVDLIYDKYSKRKSKEALLFEAKETEKLIMPNIYNIGEVNKNLLQKNLKEFKKEGLLDTEINLKNIVFDIKKDESFDLVFTKRQRDYIKNKKEVTMCIDPDWMPYEKIHNNKYIGMTSDYIPLLSKQIGLNIRLVLTKSWSESIEFAKKRRCDIFSLAMPTASRLKYMNFTIPYISFPLVISTSMDKLFIPNPESIITKEKIGIVKGYAIGEILKNKYPNHKIVDVPNVDAGMQMVLEGKIFGFLDALPTVAYTLQHKYISELKIAGKFDRKLELGIGVRNDDPILFELFEKAIQSIDEATKQEILNKYISVKFEKGFDYKFLYQGLFIISMIILFGLYRHRQLLKHNEVLEEQQLALNNSNKELHVTQKRLESSINDFEILLDSLAEAIFVFENEICIDANNVMLEMFGYQSKDEVIGKSIEKFAYIKDLKKIKKKFSKNVIPYEVHGIRKNGEVFDIMVKGTNTIINGKKVRISSVVDISEMKYKEKMLFQQSKMASMGEMIDNIAHQWRQPLSLISSVSTGLELKIQLDISNKEESTNDLKKINNTVQHLSQTIDDFRNFFKSDKEMTRFSVLDAIKRSLFLLDAIFKDNNIIVVFETQEDVIISNYENEFTQALVNIFYNAKDAMENKTKNKYIFINLGINEQDVELKIRDSAAGIDKDIIENIFEPYFTTKHQSQGTGIGLYMTHQIIENHMRGSILVENNTYDYEKEKLTGAEFIIKLPL
ncbi:ABC transporter substrate-binding protein [Arcobacter sp. LA11]|uniref:ABC transporter substrate-binding protein n=1 Tax=Arcobacter sp. LA11 TaxID=1898176 RepID=UPI0009349A9E|nr:ABC transporter substrate-binding protein [Arcobacter sp. LA11]